MSASVRCTADGGNVTVENPNDVPVQVDVSGPGEFERRVTVAAGETATVGPLADGEYTVRTLTATDENVRRVGDQTVEVTCPTEQVIAESTCDDGDGRVGVFNPNEEAVQVDVEGPGGFERRVTVASGGTATFGPLDDGEFTVTTLSAIDENVYRIGQQSVAVACEESAALAPPRFTGCGQVVVYVPEGETFDGATLVTFANGEYDTEAVDAGDAGPVPPNNPTFGRDGFDGYRFTTSGQVVGVRDPDYLNPNFDLLAENCGDASGTVDGTAFDWDEAQQLDLGVTLPTAIEVPWLARVARAASAWG